jgi:hypothetical protein
LYLRKRLRAIPGAHHRLPSEATIAPSISLQNWV